MIYRQLLTNIYQNEYHTTYNKTKASFTFTVRDAPIIIFLFSINIIGLFKNYLKIVSISDNIEVENFNFLSIKGDIHNERI